MTDEASLPAPDERYLAFDEGVRSLESLLDRASELSRDQRVEALTLLASLRELFDAAARDALYKPPDDPEAMEALERERRLTAAATRAQQLLGSGSATTVADDASASTDFVATRQPVLTDGNGQRIASRIRSTVPLFVIELFANQRAATKQDRANMWARILTAFGAIFVMFLLYLLVGSSLFESRDQHVLLREFKRTLLEKSGVTPTQNGGADEQESGVLTGTETSVGGGAGSRPALDDRTPAVPPPKSGDPVAILAIPKLGVEQVVVEGTSAVETMKGPGHLRSSPMPGERGNAVLIGRRTTYGAPFADIDQLRRGDRIIVTTPRRVSRYVVQRRAFEIGTDTEADEDPLAPSAEDKLTLVTSTPPFLATGRLAVVAELRGEPVSNPPLTLRGGTVADDETSAQPNWSALPGVFFWLQMFVLAFFAARLLYRRWLKWPTYLLTTPVLLALMLLMFDATAQLLPSGM